jgi:hypothetical protein
MYGGGKGRYVRDRLVENFDVMYRPLVKKGAMGFFSDHLTMVKNLSFVCKRVLFRKILTHVDEPDLDLDLLVK